MCVNECAHESHSGFLSVLTVVLYFDITLLCCLFYPCHPFSVSPLFTYSQDCISLDNGDRLIKLNFDCVFFHFCFLFGHHLHDQIIFCWDRVPFFAEFTMAVHCMLFVVIYFSSKISNFLWSGVQYYSLF